MVSFRLRLCTVMTSDAILGRARNAGLCSEWGDSVLRLSAALRMSPAAGGFAFSVDAGAS